jgi:hypothetical protein
MKLENNEYIIDFERVNHLTFHPIDNTPAPNAYVTPTSSYGISKSIIKEYLSLYNEHIFRGKVINPSIIKTLIWNKILISQSELRDKRIDDIL